MSMINISGIPNMGFAGGGGGYFASPSPLYQGGAAGDFGSSQFNAPLYNNFANFGKATDYYSALGAAYGRATGGFGGLGANNADPFTPLGGNAGFNALDAAANPFSAEAQAARGWGGGAKAYDDAAGMSGIGATGGGGGFSPQLRDDIAKLLMPQQRAPNPYTQMYRMPDANPSYFDPGTYAGGVPNPFSAEAQAARGWGTPAAMPDMQKLLGYNPATSAAFAPNAGGTNFQSRFGMGFPNAGTPSQYTYQPYTNAQGQTSQPNMPSSFAPGYSVDNPQGALPFQGSVW